MSDENAVVVANPITKHHKTIADLMLEQIVAQLTQAMADGTIEIESYQIDKSWAIRETIKVKLDEKLTLSLHTERAK